MGRRLPTPEQEQEQVHVELAKNPAIALIHYIDSTVQRNGVSYASIANKTKHFRILCHLTITMKAGLFTLLVLLSFAADGAVGSHVRGVGHNKSTNNTNHVGVLDLTNNHKDETQEQKNATSGDPSTALGRRQAFNNKDFVFDLASSVPVSETAAVTIRRLEVAQLPALAGQGLSSALFRIEACGIILPHVHPRATEIVFVISGQNLRVAFTEENGGRVIVNDISEGMAAFFPQGLIHYQQNLSCKPIHLISSLNHEDPGILTITTQFFRLPEEAIEGSLGEGSDVVQQLIDGLPAAPGQGRKNCLIECGLWNNDGFD